MTPREVETRAAELLKEHPKNSYDKLWDKGWRFGWDNAKTRVGQCKYRSKTITMSRHVFAAGPEQGLTDEKIIDTLLHEIAHALTPRDRGHGIQWKTVARSIGCDGNTRAKGVKPIPGKWVGTCPGCGETIDFHRKPNKRRSCSRCCPGRFNEKFLFVYALRKTEPAPVRHWKLSHVALNTHGDKRFPYLVKGANLYKDGALFYWRIPSLDNEEYDLTSAEFESDAAIRLVKEMGPEWADERKKR